MSDGVAITTLLCSICLPSAAPVTHERLTGKVELTTEGEVFLFPEGALSLDVEATAEVVLVEVGEGKFPTHSVVEVVVLGAYHDLKALLIGRWSAVWKDGVLAGGLGQVCSFQFVSHERDRALLVAAVQCQCEHAGVARALLHASGLFHQGLAARALRVRKPVVGGHTRLAVWARERIEGDESDDFLFDRAAQNHRARLDACWFFRFGGLFGRCGGLGGLGGGLHGLGGRVGCRAWWGLLLWVAGPKKKRRADEKSPCSFLHEHNVNTKSEAKI